MQAKQDHSQSCVFEYTETREVVCNACTCGMDDSEPSEEGEGNDLWNISHFLKCLLFDFIRIQSVLESISGKFYHSNILINVNIKKS